MRSVTEEIRRLAENREWIFICHQEKTSMISFEKRFDYSDKPVRINVYYRKESTKKNLILTVATSMNHPRRGRDQMYRKEVNNSILTRILIDPRLHTGKGYFKKKNK